ncbi:MAG: DUF333 domain-containing protein [Elusimicrobia bacterium]|nr:DUF333 domain-containing protein [Elusimicrobiota bacterium]
MGTARIGLLLLALPALARAVPNPASANCSSKGGKLEIYDTEGGQIGYCRLSDGAAIEEWSLLKGKKTKVAKVFKGYRKLLEKIEAGGEKATAEDWCEGAGGKLAVIGKAKKLSACFFLDRSSVDADSLAAGPDKRKVLDGLLK